MIYELGIYGYGYGYGYWYRYGSIWSGLVSRMEQDGMGWDIWVSISTRFRDILSGDLQSFCSHFLSSTQYGVDRLDTLPTFYRLIPPSLSAFHLSSLIPNLPNPWNGRSEMPRGDSHPKGRAYVLCPIPCPIDQDKIPVYGYLCVTLNHPELISLRILQSFPVQDAPRPARDETWS